MEYNIRHALGGGGRSEEEQVGMSKTEQNRTEQNRTIFFLFFKFCAHAMQSVLD
jgi:hypothetical protein